MDTTRNRSRLMSFRLSNDQYEAVKAACEHSDLRSLSEFTRMAVLQAIKRQRSDSQIWADDLATLGLKLRELDEKLGELRRMVQRLLGTAAAHE